VRVQSSADTSARIENEIPINLDCLAESDCRKWKNETPAKVEKMIQVKERYRILGLKVPIIR